MMVQLRLPRYGTNMVEATIVSWLKNPGDLFAKDEPLCDIETEKVTTQYEAPCAGTLLEIMVGADDVIAVGDVLCRVETS
jgi:pyruvate/2-oxoglutarate dehydrogenase complex dihydrolipoamide acyltransferase (E2) component